jgi:glycosyltransferase involved in cell wall biosynthesis
VNPFFSIVIPLFNSAATLPVLLESFALQRFRDFELVFMDGGSSDDTLYILRGFAREYPQQAVGIHSGPDKGIYDAMNIGVGKASGKWLYFIGGDDRLYDGYVLQDISLELTTEGTDLIYGNVEGADSGSRYVDDSPDKVFSRGIHHQGIFYRKTLFTELGKYDLTYPTAADYDFTLKVFFRSNYRVRYFNRDIAYYGERGFSSVNFDYRFFSGHYRLLRLNHALGQIIHPDKCLSDSIYCCYHLAGSKKDMTTAWQNLIWYLFFVNERGMGDRLGIFLNMLKWTFRRPSVS